MTPLERRNRQKVSLRQPGDSKHKILAAAADYASRHGLNDLTIGKLAGETGMSKAGLHGLFGSKEALQLNTIRYAQGVFTEKVISPSRGKKAGAARARAFCDAWISYVDGKAFPGGCFFGRVSMEGDSLSPEVNREIRRLFDLFRRYLSGELIKGRLNGKAAAEFSDQVIAAVVSYNWAIHALKNHELASHVRKMIRDKFTSLNRGAI